MLAWYGKMAIGLAFAICVMIVIMNAARSHANVDVVMSLLMLVVSSVVESARVIVI